MPGSRRTSPAPLCATARPTYDARILVERTAILSRLEAAVTAARAGSGAWIAVEADAGLGKTAILDRLSERLPPQLDVVRVTGHELEGEHPFGVARRLLDLVWSATDEAGRDAASRDAGRHALRLLDDDALPTELEHTVLHGTYWLLVTLAERKPLVLAVDDLHWVDEPSRRLLAYLGRRTSDVPILLVLATRPQRAGPELDGAEMFRLSPLSPEGVAHVTAGVADDPGFATACHTATGGVPLLLLGLLDELRAQERPPTAAAVEQLTRMGPPTIVRWVDRRLAEMPSGDAAIAEALVIVGDDVDLTVVADLTGQTPGEVARAADRLTRVGLFGRGPRLGFAHPVIRGAVSERLGDHVRAALHAEAARQAIDRGARPEVVADQLLRAPAGAVPGAAEALRAAASVAVGRGAPQQAVRYLQHALDEPVPAEEQPALLAALGTAQVRASHPEAAATLAHAAALADDPAARVAMLVERAFVLQRRGEAAVAVSELERELAAAAAPPGACDELRAAIVALADMDLAVRAQLADQLDAIVAGLPPAFSALALTHAAIEAALRYEDAEAVGALAERALGACVTALAGADGRAVPIPRDVLGLLTFILDAAERFETVRGISAGALAMTAAHGDVAGHAAVGSTYAFSCLRHGALGEARAVVTSLAPPGIELPGWVGGYVTGTARLIDAEFVDVGDGGPASPATPPTSAQRAMLALIEGKLLVGDGALEPGVARLLHGGRALVAMGFPAAGFHWQSDAALALARLGRHDEARAQVADELELNRRWAAPRALGCSMRADALLRATDAERVDGLRAAVEVLDTSAAPLELARALGDLGAALRRQNARRDARAPLRRAIELADECAPRTRIAEDARAELAAAGGRGPARRNGGMGSLTPSERRVVDLVAMGMSNPQVAQQLFVSRRTVETHLANAYRKLGIRGRDELATALAAAPTP